ncbi:MAG: hypothetical protein ACKO1L_09510 [Brachymonas sp.]
MPQIPPRFVPTLTQVVSPTTQAVTRPNAASAPIPQVPHLASSALLNAETIAQQTRQKLLVHMRQQIDLQLNKRIREAVSQLALEHAYKMHEELQPQIEAVVADVVEDAMRQAIAKVSVAPSNLGHSNTADANAPLKL